LTVCVVIARVVVTVVVVAVARITGLATVPGIVVDCDGGRGCIVGMRVVVAYYGVVVGAGDDYDVTDVTVSSCYVTVLLLLLFVAGFMLLWLLLLLVVSLP